MRTVQILNMDNVEIGYDSIKYDDVVCVMQPKNSDDFIKVVVSAKKVHGTVSLINEYYLAVKEICDERGYDAVSLKDVDGMKKLLGFPPAPIFMLLSDEEKLCTIPENDSLGNITQLMVKYLTGQCAFCLEFYEFFTDRVLAGVPDYVPAEVVDGKVTVMPAAFGELSEGILNVSKVESFAQNVMCQHYIISYGDNTELVENLCNILGIQMIR